MRRFFCVKCNKMKRVQQWPRIIDNVASPLPEERIGECNRHTEPTGFYLNQPVAKASVTKPVSSKRKAS